MPRPNQLGELEVLAPKTHDKVLSQIGCVVTK